MRRLFNLATQTQMKLNKQCFYCLSTFHSRSKVFNNDCLKGYFHNIEFHKEQFLLGFKEESLTLNLLILIAKIIYINVN